MWESTDGMNWSEIVYFNMKDCVAMAYYENHFVVSADNEIYYSPDSGVIWNQLGSLIISDLTFKANGTLYGIFPGPSNSSGLWSSYDFGVSWNVEFLSLFMSSVGMDTESNIFVGWELPGTDGVASWDPINQELEFFSEGLPNLNINKITYNPYIESFNVVCCTDSGAYMLTDYVGVGVENEELEITNYNLRNYPNPFKPSGAGRSPATTISFFLPDKSGNAQIEIYNLKGQNIKTIVNEKMEQGLHQIIWDGKNDNNQYVASGVYFYKLKVNNKNIAIKKCLLLK
jgi:hypothetical protein